MDASEALLAFGALAQETRLQIFRRLVRAGESGLSAGALGRELDVPPATLSFHLKELKTARLIGCRREGRSLIYGPRFGRMNELLQFLTANCCQSDAPRTRRRA